MDRKIIMGVAAVAGIGLLLYMRKSGDQATLAGSASLVGASSVPWSSTPIVINTKPLTGAVADAAAATPAPAPAPAPTNPAATAQPWQAPAVQGDVYWTGMGWNQANGQKVAEGYAFGHLTPEQRAGRTDAQMVSKYA